MTAISLKYSYKKFEIFTLRSLSKMLPYMTNILKVKLL